MASSGYPKKVWFLIAFAVVTITLVLATLFTSLTENPIDLSSTVEVPLDGPDFAPAVESVTRFPRQPIDAEIQVFDDGTRFMDDLLREIGSSEHSVTITNYIFREGQMTNAIFDAMTEAARRGVKVRVLLDWKGATKAPDERVEALRQAGGRVETFRPFGFRHLTRLHRRTHARAIVVDGRVGYTGGLAFDDGWLGDGVGKDQWRDLMFKFGGALARTTQDQFNALWRQTNGEILAGPDFYPTLGTHSAAAPDSATMRSDTTLVAAPRAGATTATIATSAAAEAAPAAGSWFVGLFHNPQPDLDTDLQDLMWLTIQGAHDHLIIATPYMTPDVEIRDALMAAARRGVRVEVVMPGPYTDAKLIQAATRAYYDDLLASGIRIFEYQPGRFHQKTVTADGHWSFVGSANLDNRSATLNVENIFGIEDPRLAAALEAESEVAKQRAVEVTVENWHPGPLKRLYFNFARIFGKQY